MAPRSRFLRRLQRAIVDSDVDYVIFWIPSCPYSVSAIQALQDKATDNYVSYTQKPAVKEELMGALRAIGESIDFPIRHRTWPVVFYQGKYLGGSEELQRALA